MTIAYDVDRYLWRFEQIEALRTLPSNVVDIKNLIHELENAANREMAEAQERTRTIIEHLLKLDFSPSALPRRGWQLTVKRSRFALADDLTPAMRAELADDLPRLYRQARELARDGLLMHEERDAAKSLLASCPYDLDEILGDDAWPGRTGKTADAD